MSAGLGYKEFATGDVLTAADANGYLASQVVMVFASAAARTAAITSPQEGMITYLKDTDVTQYYSGSAYVTIGASASPLTTKGDLYTYSTVDARLAVGANNTVLTADSTAATGIKWAAAAGGGGGKVLQVVSTTTNTLVTSSTTTYVDTTLTATITPSATSSKILVFVSHNGLHKTTGSGDNSINLRLLRGATDLGEFLRSYLYSATTTETIQSASFNFLDSPATVSATTYKTQFKSLFGTASVKTQIDSAISTITLLEIGA